MSIKTETTLGNCETSTIDLASESYQAGKCAFWYGKENVCPSHYNAAEFDRGFEDAKKS